MDVFAISPQELAELSGEPLMPEVDHPLVGTRPKLTPDQLAALPRDPERLPEYTPSKQAVADFRGQIVELADPARAQKAPDTANYLSRANHQVAKEQASWRYRINPEVVAPEFSAENSRAHQESGDVLARQKGAVTGESGGEGDPEGALVASLPSRVVRPSMGRAPMPRAIPARDTAPEFSQEALDSEDGEDGPAMDTQEGDDGWQLRLSEPIPRSPALARLNRSLLPSPSSDAMSFEASELGDSSEEDGEQRLASLSQEARYGTGGGDGGTADVTVQQGDELRGAPNNDRLDEEQGASTFLNAREFKYFGYMQLIRRQVNFYWSQALNNVGQVQQPLNRREYTTTLYVALDEEGNLQSVSLVRSCGVRNFDDATLMAFKTAAPFPPPPEGLVDEDGRAELPSFEFTVTLTKGPARYSGVDPRAHVLFPGITRIQ